MDRLTIVGGGTDSLTPRDSCDGLVDRNLPDPCGLAAGIREVQIPSRVESQAGWGARPGGIHGAAIAIVRADAGVSRWFAARAGGLIPDKQQRNESLNSS